MERHSQPKEPRHFVRRPPYPAKLLSKPYPKKYKTPTFSLYYGRKGNAIEHVNKFLDSMGPFAGNGDLCLKEFSKSLTDRAYTWYFTLQPGSITIWDDMVEIFCSKYFHGEEKVTILTFHNIKQKSSEGFLDSIGPFVGNGDLCLREFSKSLTDRAYTWYSTYSQVSLPHRMTWLKVFVQSIFMGRKRLPSSLFSILSKSPLKDSLISYGDFEMLLLIVMGSSKSKSWLRFTLTTCLMSTELI